MNTNQTPAFNQRPELDPEPEPYRFAEVMCETRIDGERFIRNMCLGLALIAGGSGLMLICKALALWVPILIEGWLS